MHEREHQHSHIHRKANDGDDDVAPGRGSRSAALDGPGTMTSGLLQRKARDENGVAANADSAVAAASSSTGAPLPDTIMRKFESSLGADLSSVRVHTGTESAAAADAVGARAYTVGQDIHFGAGQYDPSSGGGEHLLAHEVAHTVQQQGGAPMRQNKLSVSGPADAAEHEADRAADAMVSGAAAHVTSAHGLARKEAAPTADRGRIAEAKSGFDLAVDQASRKFALIAQQQGLIIQQTKEAALDKEPTLTMEIIGTIVGVAVGAAAGPLAGAIAGKVVSGAVTRLAPNLAASAVEAAVKKGGELAKKVASEQVKRVPAEAKTAEAYFNCMQLTYAALAGHQTDQFLAQMKAAWASVKDDADGAVEAQKQAEAARDGLQTALDETTYAVETQNTAFSGWCSILSHGNAGGILHLQLTVGSPGSIGGGVFEKAEIAGISGKLAGVMANRPLSVYRQMPIQITANYFAERPKVGDQSESDAVIARSFTVNISEGGAVTTPHTADAWLLAAGIGDANAGATRLYWDLLPLPVPLNV